MADPLIEWTHPNPELVSVFEIAIGPNPDAPLSIAQMLDDESGAYQYDLEPLLTPLAAGPHSVHVRAVDVTASPWLTTTVPWAGIPPPPPVENLAPVDPPVDPPPDPPPDPDPPPPPQNNVLTLEWDAPLTNTDGTPFDDLQHYRVFRKLGTTVTPLDHDEVRVTTATQIDFVDLPGGTHCFCVTAVDLAGNESLCSGPACTTIDSPPPPPPGASLVAQWRLNGNAQDHAAGHHGTVSGATFVAGRHGQGAQFDGIDDYIEIPHHADLLSDTLTLMAWIDIDGAQNDARVLHKRKGNSSNAFGLLVANTSIPFLRIGRCGSGDASVWQPVDLTQGWVHFAATYDSPNNTARVYIDGLLHAEDTNFTEDICATNVEPVQIGGHSGVNRWFRGIIDDVRIYNTVLDAAAIQAAMAGE